MNPKKPEIINLSNDLNLFDETDLSLEALEQRLEMAVFHDSAAAYCGLFSCGTYAAPPTGK